MTRLLEMILKSQRCLGYVCFVLFHFHFNVVVVVFIYSVKQFHKTKETRRLRELHLAEMKRRKLAAKIGRDVRGWWSKIEKVISYKQKLLADEERQAAMNKQLVVLVQQTEKYTESLAQNTYSEDDDEDDDNNDGEEEEEDDDDTATSDGTSTGESELEDTTDDMVTSDSEAVMSGSDDGRQRRRQQRRRRRRRRRRRMTIEEALAAENTLVRKSKKKIIDYSRIRLPSDEFYGECTASDASGSDGSYSPNEDDLENDSDPDSTLQQAIHEELRERQQDSKSTFLADPEELRKLREEVTMDIDEVIERLRQEGVEAATSTHVDQLPSEAPTMVNKSDTKHVHFSNIVQEKLVSPRKRRKNQSVVDVDDIDSSKENTTHTAVSDPGPKYDADDDADASDVEDYDDTKDQKSDEEFEAEEPEADDETTIAQEESLPREMSTAEELALLQKEGELPIEELRKIYAQHESGINEIKDVTGIESSDETINNQGDKGLQPFSLTDDGIQETTEESEEFEPPALPEIDDETTIEAEEKLGRDMSYEDEMAILKRESEIPIEELRAMYAKAIESEKDRHNGEDVGSEESNDEATVSKSDEADDGASDESADEYNFVENEAIDDETTIEAEEKLGRDMSYEDEINLLKEESEMSVEELRAKYAGMATETEEASSTNPSSDEDKSVDEEFKPNESEGVDDETTLEAEERLGREISHEEEMEILKRESEIPVEELRAMYWRNESQEDDDTPENSNTENAMNLNQSGPSSLASELFGQGSENDEDEDFAPNEADAVDDETTMEAEERLGREMSHEEEIALLKRDSETPVEELRKMYEKMSENNNDDMDKGDHNDDVSLESTKRSRDVEVADNGIKKQKIEELGDTIDDGLAALNALEASAERAKRTLASRPFLLAPWVKLRLYQQVGLNWLVSLQSRRLNGILADGKLNFPWVVVFHATK